MFFLNRLPLYPPLRFETCYTLVEMIVFGCEQESLQGKMVSGGLQVALRGVAKRLMMEADEG